LNNTCQAARHTKRAADYDIRLWKFLQVRKSHLSRLIAHSTIAA